MKRCALLWLVAWSGGCAPALAPGTGFIGVVGGISTLSADGRSALTPSSASVSLYKPENGPALNLFAGWHVNDYLSVQGNYIWNRNALTLTSSSSSDIDVAFYEQRRESAQHSAIVDALMYFRERRSRLRPYLSVGTGLVRLDSTAAIVVARRGAAAPPPARFTSTRPALRVAVGIDLAFGGGWSFRYSFSETIRNNVISAHLSPPGERNLANFQNLFGVAHAF